MKPVTLEPELERMAGAWSVAERRRMAAIYAHRARLLWRWSRQLRVSASILAEPAGARRPRRIRPLPEPVVRRN